VSCWIFGRMIEAREEAFPLPRSEYSDSMVVLQAIQELRRVKVSLAPGILVYRLTILTRAGRSRLATTMPWSSKRSVQQFADDAEKNCCRHGFW
jgi:hypothetical protein